MDEFTRKVKEFAKSQGADLAGVAAADVFENEKTKPRDLLPGAKSVVMMAMRVLKGACRLLDNGEPAHPRMFPTSHQMVGPEIHRAGHKVALFLEDHDHEAVMVRGYYGAPIDWETRGMIGDFAMRRAAVEAGLGQIGDNKLLLTEEFGPRVWLLPIITTAQLEPDGRYEGEICDHCGLCIDACPTEFLSKEDGSLEEFLKEASKCMYHNEPGALAGLLRFLENKVIGKDAKEQLKAVKTPEFWNIWYFLLFGGISYECGKCMRICPK